MNATDYHIVSMPSIFDLMLAVKELMKRGWQPQGGVSQDDDGQYLQAMVKPAPAPPHITYVTVGAGEQVEHEAPAFTPAFFPD